MLVNRRSSFGKDLYSTFKTLNIYRYHVCLGCVIVTGAANVDSKMVLFEILQSLPSRTTCQI
jgi:hypothetical protein